MLGISFGFLTQSEKSCVVGENVVEVEYIGRQLWNRKTENLYL